MLHDSGAAILGRLFSISARAQLQYRAAWATQTIGMFAISLIEFVVVWALFARFGQLKGWTLAEVGVIYGVMHMAFGLSEIFARGLDIFGNLVRTGDFDRLLVRPRSALLQVIGQELALRRLGRIGQGLLVLVWAMTHSQFGLTGLGVAVIAVSVVSTAVIFVGLFIIQAVVCFWTVESIEMMNIFTHGGVLTLQYPIAIYKAPVRLFFTFVVPIAAASFYPVQAVFRTSEQSQILWMLAAPLISLVFFLLSLGVWRFGVRHYGSTGS